MYDDVTQATVVYQDALTRMLDTVTILASQVHIYPPPPLHNPCQPGSYISSSSSSQSLPARFSRILRRTKKKGGRARERDLVFFFFTHTSTIKDKGGESLSLSLSVSHTQPHTHTQLEQAISKAREKEALLSIREKHNSRQLAQKLEVSLSLSLQNTTTN